VLDEEQLKQVFGAVLKVDPASIEPDSRMGSIESWDSLQHMILMLALEEEFSVRIPVEDAARATSFAAIKDLLDTLTGVRKPR
jgi:acyl carrier protein